MFVFSNHIVIESLWNLLLGMVGIFVVMGVLYYALRLLNRIKPGEDQDDR
jgi:hypothetical protein